MAAFAFLAAAVALLAWSGLQGVEAATAARLSRWLGTTASANGSVVRVVVDAHPDDPAIPAGGRVEGGFTIAPGCSVALFLAPMLGAAALLVRNRRLAVRAVVRAALVVGPVLLLVSQARFVATALLIDHVGQDRGFGLAHVLVGSIISTVGLVAGLGTFVWLCLRADGSPSPSPQPA
ncbi:exosortase/archaeosortase family protein [Aquihabitans sp. G128]|uniref:exosortase/archaeosortase family protein n=1 Tax=Aquihabitans sp. G128 TaxID=2849779 RepID=UPI001C23B294|nr:exosortase/archaeosortase family protein [Aquihabitans sp. G128]QXC59955.1 exosortase/archaeosortase family protein [Aquihabitans sp. G128]